MNMGHGFNKETLGLNMSQQWAWDAALNTMFMVTSSFDCLQYAKIEVSKNELEAVSVPSAGVLNVF